MNDAEYEEASTGYCAECHERDLLEALLPIYVSTPRWWRTEKLVHVECRDLFISSNLPAVLESVRLGALGVA